MMKEKETYFTQLDGIRFLAVSLVLVDHWLAERNTLPLGPLGVTMFFVLSGFLITRILIQSKTKDEQQGRSHWFSVKQFIIRRSIRIFPIYFLTIFVCYILDVPPVRETVGWCLLYATNLYIAYHQRWMGVIDHLWSLAVEEQYYLFFPYLILFLPKRFFLKTFVIMIVVSVGLRLALYFHGDQWMVQYVSMPTCLDAFGLGGLMAYLHLYHRESILEKLNKNLYLGLSFIAYLGVIFLTKHVLEGHYNLGNLVLERFIAAIFCFFLILRAVIGYQGILKSVLENSVISYIGKISYGLYLYHNFVFNFYHTPATHPTLRLLAKLNNHFPALASFVPFQLAYYFGITVVLASLSWFLIEKPVNGLKRYFTY